MKKAIVFILCLVATTTIFAQTAFRGAIKINPYTLATKRYGLQVELPVTKSVTGSIEARYLKQDWNVAGGEIFPKLSDADGFKIIGAARFYINPEAKHRFFIGPEYRYRQSEFKNVILKKSHHQFGGTSGWQWLIGERFLLDIALGLNYDRVGYDYTLAAPRIDNNANIHIDFNIGYRF